MTRTNREVYQIFSAGLPWVVLWAYCQRSLGLPWRSAWALGALWACPRPALGRRRDLLWVAL